MLIKEQTEKTIFDYYIFMIPKKAKEKFDSEQGEKRNTYKSMKQKQCIWTQTPKVRVLGFLRNDFRRLAAVSIRQWSNFCII